MMNERNYETFMNDRTKVVKLVSTTNPRMVSCVNKTYYPQKHKGTLLLSACNDDPFRPYADFRTSLVQSVQEEGNLMTVKTMNTTYVFEVL